eukprot:m.201925 g.201925  ORF g.201925 m.201925 type:complete len:820 (+) comp39601_c1_seq1:51-2510(+)
MHRRSRSKSSSPGDAPRPRYSASPALIPTNGGDISSSTPSPPLSLPPSPARFATNGTTSIPFGQSMHSFNSQSAPSRGSSISLSNLGIGDRTKKRLSVTATSSRAAATAARSDDDRAAQESRYRITLIAWEKALDEDLDSVPWKRKHLMRLFSRCASESDYNSTGAGSFDMDLPLSLLPQEVLERLSSLLRRPLVRLGAESQRLAARFGRCSRHEVVLASKLVLPTALAEVGVQAAVRAYSLFGVSMQRFGYSKSARSGLSLPAGAFHRWMLDSGIARVVSECASLYLCAVVETLAVELFRRVVLNLNGDEDPSDEGQLNREVVERRISADSELWSLLQPHAYLVPSRQPRLPVISSSSNESPSSPLLAAVSSATPLSPRRAAEQPPAGAEAPVRLGSQPPETPPARGSSVARGDTDGSSTFARGTRPGSGRSSARRSVRASSRRLDAQPLVVTTVRSRSELVPLVARALYYLQPKQTAQNHVVLAPTALDSLFYFMSSARTRSQPAQSGYHARSTPFSVDVRAPEVLPGLGEWLRIILLLIEHRRSPVADEDDVRQAARLLLPGVDCMPRLLRLDEMQCVSQSLDAEKCAIQFQQDLAFRMLSCGRSDLIRDSIPLLGKLGVDSFNMQGLTPLMYAAASGDDAMVQLLLQANANPNVSVKIGEQKGWTALTFAVLHGHTAVVKDLLEFRANPEGSYMPSQENTTDTPLQLASAGGQLDIVGLLLAYGADPFVITLRSNMKSTAVNSQWWQGSGNSFALASSHGHRKVLKKLLAQPPPSTRSCDMLSLEEILAEGGLFLRQWPSVQKLVSSKLTQVSNK